MNRSRQLDFNDQHAKNATPTMWRGEGSEALLRLSPGNRILIAAGARVLRSAQGWGPNRKVGFLALVLLPVLLAISIATGQSVAFPAAVFVPLLILDDRAPAEQAALHGALVPLAFSILAWAAAGDVMTLGPEAPNLLLAGAMVAFATERHAAALMASRHRSASLEPIDDIARLVAGAEVCSPGIAIAGIDNDLRWITGSDAARALLEPDPIHRQSIDVLDGISIFDRHTFVAAYLHAQNTGEMALLSAQLAGDRHRVGGEPVEIRIKPVGMDGAVLVFNRAAFDPVPSSPACPPNGKASNAEPARAGVLDSLIP